MAASKLRTYCVDGRTATAHFPGIGRYTANLVRALAPQLETDERLLVLLHKDAEQLIPLSLGRHANVQTLALEAGPFSLRQHTVVRQALKEQQASVFHATYLLMPLTAPVPTALSVHDFIPRMRPKESTLRARLFFNVALRAALSRTDTAICVSEATRRDLAAFAPAKADDAVVIPHAADSNMSQPRPDTVAEVKSRLGLPRRYTLYVGSNKPHKNLSGLIQAWQTVDESEQLVIAGVMLPEHPLPEFLSRERVRVLGQVPDEDLPALYAGAGLFVFPSLYEGFGLPVIEAMACGAPVACSRIPPLEELAGDAAVFFDPSDPAAMGRVLGQTLSDPSRLHTLREKGISRARDYSWDRTASDTLAVYRRLASKPVR